jgi:glutamyl-tRNA synthetase
MKKLKDSTNDILVLLYNEFKTVSAEYWFEENLQLTFENFVVKNRLKFGDVAPFMRLLLTGKGNGPSLFFIMELLGKTATIERLGDYDKLNKNLELV